MRYWKAIKRKSRSEAPGTDIVMSSVLKQERNSLLMNKLKLWFDNWIHNCSIPSFLMRGKLIMISKEESDWPKIKSIRHILVLLAVIKFFELSIIHNLENIIAKENFSKTQRGFAKGKSSLENIREVIKAATNLKNQKTKKDTPNIIYSLISKKRKT